MLAGARGRRYGPCLHHATASDIKEETEYLPDLLQAEDMLDFEGTRQKRRGQDRGRQLYKALYSGALASARCIS